MGTNIIDAFVVSFGIDARQYKTGEREVRDSLKRTKEEAKSTFDDFEDRGKKGGVALRKLANEAASFFLVLAGANSMKDFALGLIHSEAEAGRLADRLGMLPSKVVAWQQAVKGVGGNPGDASAALSALADASQNFQLTGTTGNDAVFRRLGIDRDTIKRGDPTEMLLKIAAAGEKLSKPEFNNLLGRLGMSPGMITLLMQGRGELEKTLKVAEAHANVTERDVKAAQQFEKALADLTNTIQGLARGPLTQLVEGLNDLLTNADGATGKLIGLSQAGRKWALAMAEIKAAREGRWDDLGDLLRQDFTDTTGATRNGMTPGGDANGKFRNGGGGMTPQQSALWESLSAQAAAIGSKGRSGQSGGAHDSFIQNYLKRSGFTDEQSRGIWAGIRAEGGTTGMAKNGAFGIGQWRGSRAKSLFAQYGRAPTLEQQMAFLVSELHGGDPGGAAVKRQTTADQTLLAYILKFMRPQGARNEHYMDAVRDVQRGRNALAGRGGTTNIGTINVHTRATDAPGIARSIGGALKFRHTINQANSGIAP